MVEDALSRKKEIVATSVLVSEWKLIKDFVCWNPFIEDKAILCNISIEADWVSDIVKAQT